MDALATEIGCSETSCITSSTSGITTVSKSTTNINSTVSPNDFAQYTSITIDNTVALSDVGFSLEPGSFPALPLPSTYPIAYSAPSLLINVHSADTTGTFALEGILSSPEQHYNTLAVTVIGDVLKNISMRLDGYVGYSGNTSLSKCTDLILGGGLVDPRTGNIPSTFSSIFYNMVNGGGTCKLSDLTFIKNNAFYCEDGYSLSLDSSGARQTAPIATVTVAKRKFKCSSYMYQCFINGNIVYTRDNVLAAANNCDGTHYNVYSYDIDNDPATTSIFPATPLCTNVEPTIYDTNPKSGIYSYVGTNLIDGAFRMPEAGSEVLRYDFRGNFTSPDQNNWNTSYTTSGLSFGDITPSPGQNGTEQGSGSVFLYSVGSGGLDTSHIDLSNSNGSSGLGGNILNAGATAADYLAAEASQTYYCQKVSDWTSYGSNSVYASQPVIVMKRYDFVGLTTGSLSGTNGVSPNVTSKEINVYLGLDSSTRAWLESNVQFKVH
jgi:hypothetical protein